MKYRTPLLIALGAALSLTGGVAAAAPNTTPDTAALAGELANQQLNWEPCSFEASGLPAETQAKLAQTTQCATVTVPRDWHNAGDGNTFQIRISRAGNVDPAGENYRGTLFINPGGPGGSGLHFSGMLHDAVPDLAATHNFVGFDPRGVGQSTNVQCTFTYNADEQYSKQKAIADTCGNDANIKAINTEQTAYDVDFIRHLLEVEKLSFLGYSYGTWLGTWYASVFGANTEALILDSSMNVTAASLEPSFDLQAKARDRQFHEHLMNWIARHNDTYGLGQDPNAIYRAYLRGQAALDPAVLHFLWLFTGAYDGLKNNAAYPTSAQIVQLVVAYGQFATGPAKASANPAATALELLKSAEQTAEISQAITKAEGLSTLTPVSGTTTESISSIYQFVLCQDGQYTQDLAVQERKLTKATQLFPFSRSLAQLTVSPCAFWETNLTRPLPKADFPKTILLQSELDSQTGWEGGQRSGLHLPNTSFIAIDNENGHGVFPYGLSSVDTPVINLLNNDELPQDITVVQAKPVAGDNAVYESWKPLNDQAQHYGENVNDPRQPVPGAGPSPSENPVTAQLAEADRVAAAERLTRDIYGDAGAAALEN